MSKEVKVSALTVPAERFYLGVVRGYVEQVAKKIGFSDKDVDALSLAACEAATNVVEHAFSPEDEEAVFDVICEVSSLGLKVVVRDRGLPFSPEQVEKFSVDDVREGKKPKGLGLFLMEKSVDEFSFHNLGFEGKEVHLVKYIHRRRIEDYFDDERLKAYADPAASDKKSLDKISYKVELMNPKQAIEISQCAYRTYGYNYISDFIYYPERVVEMNKRGELISAVAMTDEGQEVMGHAALEIDASRELCELGVAFTKPQFRNQGCFNRLTQYLLEVARVKREKGVYARAVTFHPYSQKALVRQGFRECAGVIGLAPATLFAKSAASQAQRESVVILFRNVSPPDITYVYAPPRHKKILEKIYKHIEVPIQWCDLKDLDKKMLSGQKAVTEVKVNHSLANASIFVNQYGPQVLEEISQSLKRLTRERLETVQLYLDLKDPYTAIFVKDFAKLGFFFGGLLPTHSRHNLILQYLNNLTIDYSRIATASDFGVEFVSYINERDPNNSL